MIRGPPSEELREINLKGEAKAFQSSEGGVHAPLLELLVVPDVQPAGLGRLFLRPALPRTFTTQATCQPNLKSRP